MSRRNALILSAMLLVLLAGGTAYGHGMSEADQKAMLEGGYYRYAELGAKHMLTGYDHLLFLFGVMFFLNAWNDIFRFVTAFTLGHCITLVFATFLGLKANYYLIDAVIGFSVCYKGFDNLDGFPRLFGMKSPNLLGMVFAFGLIHGFGLSARLQQLPLGEPSWPMLFRILSFNVGVEVGQVIALAVILLVLSRVSVYDWWTPFSNICNTGLVLAGLLLVGMQLHGYSHQQYPDDFPLNLHQHGEVHYQILVEENKAREEQQRKEAIAARDKAAKDEVKRQMEEAAQRSAEQQEAFLKSHGHSHGS